MPAVIDPWGCIFGAFLLLTLPLNWLAAAAAGALFHELCHLAMLRLVGGKLLGVRLGVLGAALEVQTPTQLGELLCALAGPVGSMLLVLTLRSMPRLALCALVQGTVNLLPIYPLDGGRVLHCVLAMVFPGREERLQPLVETAASAALIFLALTLGIRHGLGLTPAAIVLAVILRSFLRKRPCKPRQIRVQ